ncbi:MAG TPA: FtsL-like putative cell division protein [Prevotella sp.]
MTKDKETENLHPKLTIEDAPEVEKAVISSPPTNEPHAEEAPSLREVIKEQATEDELPLSKNFTLRKILGGDILTTSTIRRQIWLFMLITFFMIIYIANRYSCQQNLIEIDKLQRELQDAKYKALSSNSQLTEKSRESHVLEQLKNNNDSALKIASQPPYIINVPENE